MMWRVWVFVVATAAGVFVGLPLGAGVGWVLGSLVGHAEAGAAWGVVIGFWGVAIQVARLMRRRRRTRQRSEAMDRAAVVGITSGRG